RPVGSECVNAYIERDQGDNRLLEAGASTGF
ncbi:MAG: hypothetical protein ACI9S9_001638, partial [Planctomycetota bacterium]